MSSPEFQVAPLVRPSNADLGVLNALRHWHEHRPKMYTALYANGTLVEMATAAHEAMVDDTMALQSALIQEQGYDASTAFVLARQTVRERYVYLPTEEDVPELMQTESGIYTYESEQGG